MSNLEAKTKMSSWQLALVVSLVCANVGGITTRNVIETAGRLSWLCALIGAVVAYCVALVFVKLAEQYPDETATDYLPRLWGNRLGGVVLLLMVMMLAVQIMVMVQMISREIQFFMLDRTPFEVVEMGLLGVAAYCALQDWGTILRVAQIIFFTAAPAIMSLIFLSMVNFDIINLLPLWPLDYKQVLQGTLVSLRIYGGTLVVLVLFPLVYRGSASVKKTLAAAFALNGVAVAILFTTLIGVLSEDGARLTPFPILVTVRAMELPGTFIERLDMYHLVFWLQAIFISVSISMFVIARILMRAFGYADHRPFVLGLAPVLFIGADALHNLPLLYAIADFNFKLGLFLYVVVMPLSYILARRRKDREHEGICRNS